MNPDEKPVQLSSLTPLGGGAAVLVSYAGCSGCQAEIIRWREVASRNPSVLFRTVVVAESAQEAALATRGVLERDSVYRMPIKQWQRLGERRVPLLILLGANGDVRWKGTGYEDLQKLDSILASERHTVREDEMNLPRP
jgi:hypothetical protein